MGHRWARGRGSARVPTLLGSLRGAEGGESCLNAPQTEVNKSGRVGGAETDKGRVGLKDIPVVRFPFSPEEQELAESCGSGANGCEVKTVGFGYFIEAVGALSVSWAMINQPPPGSASQTYCLLFNP
jgi:hypothetical protein